MSSAIAKTSSSVIQDSEGSKRNPEKPTEIQNVSEEMHIDNRENSNQIIVASSDPLQDAETYVNEVIGLQQVSAVLGSPLYTGRKRHLSMPANGESELKKLKSENLTLLGAESDSQKGGSEKTNSAHDDNHKIRNVVKAKRNLLKGKSCSSSLKLKAANIENKHSQNKVEKKKGQTSRTKSPAGKSTGRRNRKEEKDSTRTDPQPLTETSKITKHTEVSKRQKDMPDILSAISSMENRMHKEFIDMKTSNENIFKHVQEEIGKIKTDFNARIEGLAKKIEKRVCETLSKEVDKKLSKHEREMTNKNRNIEQCLKSMNENVKHLEETVIPTLNEKLGDEIDEVIQKCERLENNRQDVATNNNIIVRNLPERENENTVQEVNNILKVGLNLRFVTIETAERKQNRQDDRKPGIIVAKCKSKEDKQNIMKSKRLLKDSRRYERVFIENDLPKSQRVLHSNLRTIVKTIGKDKLRLKGSRVSATETESNTSERRSNERERADSYRNTQFRDKYDNRRNSQYNQPDSHYRNDNNRSGRRDYQKNNRSREFNRVDSPVQSHGNRRDWQRY